MKFKDLLIVTDSKQKMRLFNPDKTLLEEEYCVHFWELELHFDRTIVGLLADNDFLLVYFS